MIRFAAVAAIGLTLACRSKSGSGTEELPPAKSWNAPEPVASEPGVGPGTPADDPHAGLDMGGDPHAGLDMGGDPHTGLDMGGDPHAGLDMGGDPHAGLDMGGADDPAMAALDPPDPNRAIDPSKYLRGVIDGTAETRPKIAKGAILFVAVRPIDPKTGSIVGSPIAVDRIDINSLPLKFELTGEHAMVAGTKFEGTVLIDARVDGDGEARTKEPGDIVGSVRATIPAGGLTLELDTLLR